jgi:hypothetical protein
MIPVKIDGAIKVADFFTMDVRKYWCAWSRMEVG